MDNKADVIITDDIHYSDGLKKLETWEEIAAVIFPKLQEEYPELRPFTLEQFIQECPWKMEIVQK